MVRKQISAIDAISGSRLDVFARTDYVLSFVTGFGKSWSRQLYQNYLNAAGVSAKDPEDGKGSIQDYVESFTELIKSMIVSGFDGAHRLAAALVLDCKIWVEHSDELDSIIDYRWLENSGLDQDYINHMAFELLRFKFNARAFVFFDIESQLCDQLEDDIRDQADVVIRRRIQLTEVGKRRIINLLYDYNDWWHTELLEQFVIERFDKEYNSVEVIFTLENDLSSRQLRKERLRTKLPDNIFERKIHGTDSFFDTLWLAESVLNQNAIAFLNSAPIGSEDEILERIGTPTRITPQSRLFGDYCIDGSAVLELHGLRNANDIDYIYYGLNCVPAKVLRFGDCHNYRYGFNSVSLDEIIFNPRLHFYFRGVKFISLGMLLLQKYENNSVDSMMDCDLIIKSRTNVPKIYFNRDARKIAFRTKIVTLIKRRVDRWLRKLPRFLEIRIRKNIVFVREIFD
jgi:hypothetical protein